MVGQFLKKQDYIDLESPINVMSKLNYYWIISEGLKSRRKPSNPKKISNFVGRVKGLKVFVGNFTYECDFVVVEDTTSVIDHYLGGMVLGKPFVKEFDHVYDKDEGTVTFEKEKENITFKMPDKMESFKHIDRDFLKTDNIPPFIIIGDDDDQEKTHYSNCLNLGPAYRRDESVFSIWKAFEGNTRDLGSFGEETDKTTDLHQHLSRLCSHRLETAYQVTRDAVTTHPMTVLQHLTTTTTKLRNDILMFQQHHGEYLSEAWTHYKDLLQKVPHHGIDLWLQVQIFYGYVNPVTRQTIDQSACGKLRDLNAKESWALLEDLSLYDNESWNDPRDLAKPVKAIALPQDVTSTSDRRLIELENQVQRLMEAHLALTQPT
ncbi:MAK10-like protein [Tanacetum coccineum]|uniref:MAK10-like protein n=1 Tax=Tanacetum coccineum TaxID=301880 RepID=A0ABQ5EA47_9ASTR